MSFLSMRVFDAIEERIENRANENEFLSNVHENIMQQNMIDSCRDTNYEFV